MPDQSQFVVNPETGDIGVEDEEQGMSIPLDHAQSVDGQVVGQVQTNPETGDQGIEDDTHGVSRPFDPVEYAQEVEWAGTPRRDNIPAGESTAHSTHHLSKAEIQAQLQQGATAYQQWQTTATDPAKNEVNPPNPYAQLPRRR